ncbi:MAG: T9SS type A sorting domain-containing protein [Bacteroidetes bacterium]|nr:T9SS type A sorting domain-containing protein [Bacteroidota bacterium]MBU1721076.1 T9SS type A sorting domain-containing protein [Bacteroidota bacterium]
MKKLLHKHIALFCISLLVPVISLGQLVNDGGIIMIESGADVYITGGGTSFTNQSDGVNYGNVHSFGNIFLDGHWVNETQTTNSTNATFNAGAGTVRFNGSANCNLNSGGYAFYNLIVDNTAGITITTNDCRVDNTMTLTNGKINTGSNILSIENYGTGSLSGFSTANYINGYLTRRVTTGYFTENFATLPYSTNNTTTNSTKGSIIKVTSTSNDPMIRMETILSATPYNPATYKYVEVRYRVLAGTAGNMELFWCTPANPFARGGFSTSNALISDGNWHNLVIDLFAKYTTTGDNGQDVIGFRYDWCTANGVTMDIDYIKITGTPSEEFDFPVGTASQYEIAKVKINNSTGITHLNSNFVAFNPPTIPYGNILAGLQVNGTAITEILDYGYWDIYPNSGGASTSYDEILTSRGHTNGGTPEQHTVVKRADAGTDWACFGTHDNATQSGSGTNPVTAKRSAVSGFSHHAIARSEDQMLPIEMLSFEGFCDENSITLSWSTSSEINNDYFELEKSPDLNNWDFVGMLDGAGNSNFTQEYSLIDSNPYEATTDGTSPTFYRLKQIDFNGNVNIHGPFEVLCEEEQANEFFNAYLNSDRAIVVNFTETLNQPFTVCLFDNTGRQLVKEESVAAEGMNQIQFPANEFSRGIYLLVFKTAGKSITKKIILN